MQANSFEPGGAEESCEQKHVNFRRIGEKKERATAAGCGHLMWLLLAAAMSRLVVIEKGETGFGVVCNNHNVITSLKGRADEDNILQVGDAVLEVDGDRLERGERLIDRIRSKPGRTSFTLSLAPRPTPSEPAPSLNQLMKGMIASPAFKKMATKMVVGMVTQGDPANMLGGVEQAAGLPNPAVDGTAPPGQGTQQQQQQQQQQLALAQKQDQLQRRQQLEAHLELQVGAILESDAFGSMVDKVTESPGIQKIMHDAEQGKLCADAEGFHAVAACLLDGGLLRAVTDASCEATGADSAECEQVHAMASTMLARIGLRGDGWVGWFVRRLILRPWLATALELCFLLLAAAGSAAAVRSCASRWRQRKAAMDQRSACPKKEKES